MDCVFSCHSLSGLAATRAQARWLIERFCSVTKFIFIFIIIKQSFILFEIFLRKPNLGKVGFCVLEHSTGGAVWYFHKFQDFSKFLKFFFDLRFLFFCFFENNEVLDQYDFNFYWKIIFFHFLSCFRENENKITCILLICLMTFIDQSKVWLVAIH